MDDGRMLTSDRVELAAKLAISARDLVKRCGKLEGIAGIDLDAARRDLVMTVGSTVPFLMVFASNVMVDPTTVRGWLEAIFPADPVSWMTMAMRGLMGGEGTTGQVALALSAPVTATALLAPQRSGSTGGPDPVATDMRR